MIPNEASWGAVLRHISTSSAVNPAMLVCIASMIFGFLGLEFAPTDVNWVFIILILFPLVIFSAQIILFSLVDRDRLQNDKHVEQKMMISKQVIGEMRDGKPIEIRLPKNEQQSPNPQLYIEKDV